MTEFRKFHKAEELANAISHLGGAALAAAGLVLMIVFSAIRGNAWHIVTTSIYGTTLFILYFASGMAHALNEGKAKNLFFLFDKIAIFLLIAGTYTPLSLVLLQGWVGWMVFGLEWGLAILGIVLSFTSLGKSDVKVNYLFVGLYAGMGWMLLIAIVPIVKALPAAGLLLLISGGLSYTFGILFYAKARFPFYHLVWHMMVVLGSILHFLLIFYYVIPG
ncbi:MAG: hemolysin III family protein [Bacteroidales bacterium]|nr:hemolysin III family protein [Bacteroidales bacterium]MCB9000140.1 hemolysin III family protein [Bacteroidales bacterium]MCB9013497.1 hemolysin III family protein [Bacteroidales bacterium]